jgi:hypothetical protein
MKMTDSWKKQAWCWSISLLVISKVKQQDHNHLVNIEHDFGISAFSGKEAPQNDYLQIFDARHT